MTTFELKATKRTLFGRKTKQLRKKGIVPANIFGKNLKSLAIELESTILLDTMRKSGETGLIHLKVEGDSKVHPVLVSGYAKDSVYGAMLHVDFHEVDLKQKTKATVPLHTTGESEAFSSGLVLVMMKNEVEVEALPTDLPDSIMVDITSLKAVGDSIHAKDLKLDRSKVELIIEDAEVIATIQEPAKEEVVEAPAEPAEGATEEASAEAKPEAATDDKKE